MQRKHYIPLLVTLMVMAATTLHQFKSVNDLRAKALAEQIRAGEALLQAAELKAQVDAAEAAKVEHKSLVEFTLTAMDMEPKTRVSDAVRPIVAEKVVRFVTQYIWIKDALGNVDLKATHDAREQYISMVKIESNFSNAAKSPVGATGIGQIMPATFNWTIKLMEGGARPEDITNEDVNLVVGAYYYNMLLGEQKNNPRLASIAYNGGPKTADRFKKLVDINQESANYALKTDHVKATVKETVDAKQTK